MLDNCKKISLIEFKQRFIEKLNILNINYCVLRNYEELFISTLGDIDFLVVPESFGLIERVFSELCSGSDFYILHSCLQNKNLILKATPKDQVFSSFQHPEIVHFHFVAYVSLYLSNIQRNTTGLATRVWQQDIETQCCTVGPVSIRIPTPEWELLFTYSRLEFRSYDKYLVKCWELLSQEQVKLACGERLLTSLSGSLGRDDVFNRDLLRELYRRIRPEGKLCLPFRWISLVKMDIKNLSIRKGLVIVFSGPDGAGKTTTNENLSALMRDGFGLRVKNVKHLYPLNNILGGGAVNLQAKIRRVDPNNGLGMERDRGQGMAWKLRRFAGLFLILIQYPVGFFLAKIATLRGVTTIVDTSIFDAFVKGHRPQFKLLERAIVPFLPKGDLWFVLSAAPSVIVQRKPELTLEEIEQYYNRINNLAKKSPHQPCYILSEGGEMKSLNLVTEKVLEKISGYNKGHF